MPSHHARRRLRGHAGASETFHALCKRHKRHRERHSVAHVAGNPRSCLATDSNRASRCFPGRRLPGKSLRRTRSRGHLIARRQELAAFIQAAFSGPTLRLYTNNDPTGVELGASLKNVIAIAAGVCHGLHLGSNTMAASDHSRTCGDHPACRGPRRTPQTLAGLAGLGDLVLTCTGDLSRNRRVGMELAAGRSLQDIVGSMTMIAEGVDHTRRGRSGGAGIHRNADHRADVRHPSTGKSPREAVRELMERSLKPE